jgi:hypothetical protein
VEFFSSCKERIVSEKKDISFVASKHLASSFEFSEWSLEKINNKGSISETNPAKNY